MQFILPLVILCAFFLLACGEQIPQINKANGLLSPDGISVVESVSSVSINWNAEEGKTYRIYFSTDENLPLSSWEQEDVSRPPYVQSNLLNNTTYYYRISTVEGNLVSEPSDIYTATPSTTLLRAPANISVVVGDRQLELSWNAVPGVQQYKIYWTDTPESDPRLSGKLPRTATEPRYLFSGLSNDKAYYFVITSFAGAKESEASEKVWGIPQLTRPESPVNLRVLTVGSSWVKITWDKVASASSYKVYWARGAADFNLELANSEVVSASDIEFTLRQLNQGEDYYVKVAAINEFGEGEASVALPISGDLPVVVDPQISPPTNVDVLVEGVTAKISWNSDDFSNQYRFFYATEPGVTPENFGLLENGAASDIEVVPQGALNKLIVAKRYYLVVVSLNGNRQSVPSEEISFLVKIPNSHFEKTTLSAGGQLYARWYNPINTPSEYHPLWQEVKRNKNGSVISQATLAESWHCAECHGWDYKGRDGAFANGSNRYTGFPGLKETARNMTPEEIYNFIRWGKTQSGLDHAFSDIGYDNAISLVNFIMKATNVSDFWFGNARNGEQIFKTPVQNFRSCTENGCHTQFTDIKDIDILPRALEDTAKAVHTIQFGMGRMPGGRSLQDARDVLAYLWESRLAQYTNNFDQARYNKVGQELQTQIAQGGRLYDRWWNVRIDSSMRLPQTNHPLWPENNANLASSYTWRCQACHGWDYQGNSGSYSKGIYFTGIPGILQSTLKTDTPEKLYNFLRTADFHSYGFFLQDDELYALTRFVLQMREESENAQSVWNLLDDTFKEPIQANVDLGSAHYNSSTANGGCQDCHIKNSNTWFFNDIAPERNEIQTPVTIARNNPWEFLHKIRFGQPGSIMTGLTEFPATDINTAIDILAYVQTSLSPDIKRGGRLYDNWWQENGLKSPLGRHALWPATGSSVTPADTWRCVSCHGWDYSGNEGFGGLLNPVRDIKTFIENGTVLNSEDHAFSAFLKRQDIADLDAFITSPVDGVRSDISSLISFANSVSGKQIYESETPGNCIFCHGVEGTSIPSVDLKTLSTNFNARFVHVARFGSPGSSMLPGLSRYIGLSAENAADVQAYTSTMNNAVTTPVEGLERGGRLFDNWFTEMKAVDPNFPDPVVKNPLWEMRNPSVPDVQSLSDSWRCVNCHSWTYKGRDILADTPEADNLIVKLQQRKTLYSSDQALSDYLYNWIKNGSGSIHNYGTVQSGLPGVLGDRELKELVVFLMQGVKDSSAYIYNLDGKVINADAVNGGKIYTGSLYPDINCQSCHGELGTSTPPNSGRSLDIFTLANENPWQFLHKLRFAAPATEMPALEGIPQIGFQDMLDVLGFAQTQATAAAP